MKELLLNPYVWAGVTVLLAFLALRDSRCPADGNKRAGCRAIQRRMIADRQGDVWYDGNPHRWPV